MKHFLIVLACFYTSLGFAQVDIATELAQIELMSEEDDNLAVINLCKELLKKTAIHDSTRVDVLNTLAIQQDIVGDYDAAQKSYEQAIRISKKAGLNTRAVEALINYGLYYEMLGVMEMSIKYYKEAVEICTQNNKTIDKYWYANALHCLATASEIQHRYDEAESLYKEALNMATANMDNKSEEYLVLVNNFGMLYFFTNRYKEAIPFFLKVTTMVEDNVVPMGEHTGTFCNLADCYAHLGQHKEAEDIYLRMCKLDLAREGESAGNYPVTISRLGDLYYLQGRLAEAKEMHLKAIALAEKHIEPQFIDFFYILEQAYLFFEKTEDWAQVRAIGLKCFENNCMDELPSSGTLKNIESLAQTQTFATMPYALKALQSTAFGYWKGYQSSGNMEMLENAYHIQEAILLLLNRLKNSFATELDKLELLTTTQRISEQGIQIAQALYKKTGDNKYREAAFRFIENNKYVLLQDALQAREAQRFGNAPAEIVVEEAALEQALTIAKTKKIQAIDEESRLKAVEGYNKALQAVNKFQERLQQKYPDYHQFKYAVENPKIADLQAKLPKDALLMEYFVGNDNTYLYLMDTEDVIALQLPLSKEKIEEKVHLFRKELSDYGHIAQAGPNSIDAYQELAHWFYQELMAPALEKMPNKKRLIIIPDGLLGHLPFEAFLTSKPEAKKEFKDLDYVLKTYSISYLYAANLLNNKQTENKTNHKILGMAASYDAGKAGVERAPANRSGELRSIRNSLQPLPAAIEEVKLLESNFAGTYLYGESANEANFKKNAPDYAVLHLAMHGLLNEKHPILSSLAFTENGDAVENNFLQAFEISQMKLKAQLVVLSACETGYGKFQQGEGVMSLARSFMYAGVPSLVVSMWQVNDASTSLIMQDFYQNLAKGMDKAEALRQAKLSYIEKASLGNPMAAHPAFWAAFVQLGDSQPIIVKADTTASLPWPWIGGGLAALAAIGLGAVALRKRKEA